MKINPHKLSEAESAKHHKVLLLAAHGVGKTTQAIHMAQKYGKGLLISGEGGLLSISGLPGSENIDVIEFTSWETPIEGSSGVPFKSIFSWLRGSEGQSRGYKWVMIDSLTELSDLCFEHWQKEHEGSKNQFAVYGDFGASMVGALKAIRDLPYHVVVSSLVKTESNDNGETNYWPLIKGQQTQRQVPGALDHVWFMVRVSDGDRTNPTVRRYIVTDESRGYMAKTRDPRRRLKTVEESGNITELFDKMSAPSNGHEAHMAKVKADTNTTEQE